MSKTKRNHKQPIAGKEKNKRVVNLPSVKLPIKPLTMPEIEEDINQRLEKIETEFRKGFDFIKTHSKSVTFFGSARLKEDDPYYKKAESIAKKVADLGYAVLTGGGPGVMEAANKGALEAYGQSLGLTIELPHEQNVNPFVTDYCNFYYFFIRKVCLTFSAEAYIYFPGGFGTLDEFFEIATLVQTKKIEKVPIILVGNDFWKPLDSYIKKELLSKYKTVGKSDTKLYQILEDEKKIINIIKRAPVRQQ